MTHWQRPGPLNIWKIVDGYEELADGTKIPAKFSIQDIPNEDKRKEEVYDLMITHYLTREPLNKILDIIEDSDAVNDHKRTFKFAMDHNISVGCYKLNPDGKIGELVGVNLLYVRSNDSFKDIQKLKSTFKSKNFIQCWNTIDALSMKVNLFEKFKVDKYIASRGFCIKSTYEGQNLGYHLLDARSAIGKMYGIYVTASVFSASASQQLAQRAGFEELASIDFAELVDDQGNPQFPNIESKSVKLMIKRLP